MQGELIQNGNNGSNSFLVFKVYIATGQYFFWCFSLLNVDLSIVPMSLSWSNILASNVMVFKKQLFY